MFARSTQRSVHPMFRCRDVAGGAAVLLAGGSLIFTALMGGAPPSGQWAMAGFLTAVLLLLIGFGGGAVLDRVGDRFPALTRAYDRPFVFMLLVAVLSSLLLWAWWERERIVSRAGEMIRIDLPFDAKTFFSLSLEGD